MRGRLATRRSSITSKCDEFWFYKFLNAYTQEETERDGLKVTRVYIRECAHSTKA